MLPPTRPTRVRYLILGLTTLSAVLLYLDRFCISFAERYIREDLGLSNTQISWILSAFFWTYALAQVPSGFLTDRFGARLMLTLYIVSWSVFTGLTGLAGGFLTLMALRFGFGIAQAGAYPTSANLIGKWVPYSTRGLASGLVAFGGRMGGFLAPTVTALLIVFFVPRDVSSLLTADDILDYPQLCYQLSPLPYQKDLPRTEKVDENPGLFILSHLPAEVRTSVSDVAKKYQADRKQEGGGPARSTTQERKEEIQKLATALNEVLKQRTMTDAFSREDLALPGEAEKLLLIPPSELTQNQVERLNRLLLEAVYPQAIKKIYCQGWRATMVVFGSVGLVLGLLFWILFRNRPDLHPWCNPAEVELIEGSRPAGALSPHGQARRVPLGTLASSVSMWLMCLSQFGTNIGWIFLVTWLPRYLDEVHHLPIEMRGLIASLPLVAGWIGMLSGGWFTDWFARRVGVRWGRALPIALTRFLAMAAYFLCLGQPSLWTVTLAFCLVSFATDFGIPSMWAFNLDVGGRYVGSVLGWGNMWGNFGAALSPPLLNWIVSLGGLAVLSLGPWGALPLGLAQWDLVFLTCAAAFFLSGVCGLGINATVPLDPGKTGEAE